MQIVLELDDLDEKEIRRAIAIRQAWGPLPDGDGNTAGRVVAEICRGWLFHRGKPLSAEL
jgi:hypothetical protein